MINKTKCSFFKKINKIVKNCRMVYQEKIERGLKNKGRSKRREIKINTT